jgi:hypothetical protein
LTVAAVIVGTENLEDEALHELNEETNGLRRRTSKDSTNNASVIMEGVRSTAFDAEACADDADEDPVGLLVEDVWIEDVGHDVYRRQGDSVSVREIFKVTDEDLLVADSIVDESRGVRRTDDSTPITVLSICR